MRQYLHKSSRTILDAAVLAVEDEVRDLVAAVPVAAPAGCIPPALIPACTLGPSPEVSMALVVPPKRNVNK